MMIAPGASPVAGHFQLLWGESLSRWEILGLFPKIYLGKHVGHPQIRSLLARRVKLFSDPEVYVQAEGELIGRTPLELVVHPGSLPFAATAERKEAHPAKEYLQHFHASGAFHAKDLWHHNIIPATTSVPQQRPCHNNVIRRHTVIPVKRREPGLSADRTIKISPPGIALLHPSCLPVIFQAFSYFLKLFRRARLPLLASRLRGNDVVEANGLVEGMTLLRE